MSEFQQEIVKILLDKGILGLIVGFGAYFLNKSIEKYKAKNTYYQKLSEAKIQAYKELHGALGMINLRILEFSYRSLPAPTDKDEVKKEKYSVLESLYQANVVSNIPYILMNMSFFSESVDKSIDKYIDELTDLIKDMKSYLKANQNIDTKKLNEKIYARSEVLDKTHEDVCTKLKEEIIVSPFD